MSETTRRTTVKGIAGIGTIGLAGCVGESAEESDNNNTNNTTGNGDSAEWPDGPIEVVVPYGAGGGTDTMLRTLQPYLEEELGANLAVDNRPGAGARIGTEYALSADPDGYTLEFVSIPTAILGDMFFDTDYNVDDATIFGTTNTHFYAQFTPPGRWESIEEFANAAGEEDLTIAHSGVGSNAHFIETLFLDGLGVADDVTYVPYDSGGDIVSAILSEDNDLGSIGLPNLITQIEEGELDLLFLPREGESPFFPDAKTVDDVEYDIPGVGSEQGFIGPPGIQDEIVNTFTEAMSAAAEKEDYIEDVTEQGGHQQLRSPDETKEFMSEIKNLGDQYESVLERTDQLD